MSFQGLGQILEARFDQRRQLPPNILELCSQLSEFGRQVLGEGHGHFGEVLEKVLDLLGHCARCSLNMRPHGSHGGFEVEGLKRGEEVGQEVIYGLCLVPQGK